MEDKWIPNHPDNKILFPVEYDEWEWRVSDLIDWSVHQWDRERIYMLFNQFDAEVILRIPLSRRQVQDKLVWKYCRNGKYAIKSGYHVARMLDGDTNGREESSRQKVDHWVWNQLWQICVPSKIKVFGWRACLNILPSKVNLVRRQVLTEDRCEICQRCSETVIHAI